MMKPVWGLADTKISGLTRMHEAHDGPAKKEAEGSFLF